MGIDRSRWEGERVGIDRSGVGGGESGDRQEWGGMGERVGIERGSEVGGGERGDRHEKWGGRGREWGWIGGVGWEGVGIGRRSDLR